jgi:hypothetical protein
MSVILELNYAKKIGLPNYSSHQFAVTIRTELGDLSLLEKTNAELYARLQNAVDSQIVNAGHLPTETQPNRPSTPPNDNWTCSPKQRELIQKIIGENQLNPADIEKLAVERFKTGLKQLNKVQASSIIDELIETHGKQGRGQRSYAGRGRP